MKIIDHGWWVPYTPTKEERPEHAPANALFAKRESDGKDWYKHVNDPASFQPDSVKIAFMFHEFEQEWIIGPSTTDPTLIFPANMHVREILDFERAGDEQEIIKAFRNKVIDLATNAMKDRPRPEPGPSLVELIDGLSRRVATLEERMKQWQTDQHS